MNPDAAPPVEVPHDALPPDVLRRVLEDYVTRGGTDDGQVDVTLEDRVALVMKALLRKQARILWDPDTEQCVLVPR